MAFWRPFDTSDGESESENPKTNAVAEPLEFRNKDLHIQTQRIILNIYTCLKSENHEASENEIVKRICELTKVPRSTVYKVIKVGDIIDHSLKRKRSDQKLKKIDNTSKEVIRRVVYQFYKDSKVPTLEMIRDKLSDYQDYEYKSLDTLRNILLNCGFKYKKLDKRMVIMESHRIVAHRQEYLRKIQEYRQGKREIVYLDETWFDTHDVVEYGWVDDSSNCKLNGPCSRGKRVIILHAGSDKGFVPNALLLSAKNIKHSSADYHEDMTASLFEKWFIEQLLPNIPPNSVIVMDNASYHSRLHSKIPNSSTKKDDILKFMESKNMEIPQKATKKVLLEAIKKKNFTKEYVIDKLCEAHGHTILRLPPYYCIFNPIEMMWAAIKKKLRKYNQSPTKSDLVLGNIRTVIDEVNASGIWMNCVRHVIEKEGEYFILPAIDPIIITPNTDSSSADSDSDFS